MLTPRDEGLIDLLHYILWLSIPLSGGVLAA